MGAAMQSPPLSYRAHPAVTQAAFVEIMEAHRAADRLVKGQYWSDGKGCAVGCGSHAVMALTGETFDHADHEALGNRLGVPLVLMRLQDTIFEGLSQADAMQWPVRFARAIPEGIDLSSVWPQFCALQQRRLLTHVKRPDVRAVVERVAVGYETNWQNDCPEAAASDAWAAESVASYRWMADTLERLLQESA
jgi:hypothetical protein